MIIGFTGTRNGMTTRQRQVVEEILRRQSDTPKEFHHGDCSGSDEEAHFIALRIGCKIVIHPPENAALRAFCHSKNIRDPKPYIERNHDIVDEAELLIATPKTQCEQMQSGTWATVRYARGFADRTIIVIQPNGVVHERAARHKVKYKLLRKV